MHFPVISSNSPKMPPHDRVEFQSPMKEDDASSTATSVLSDFYSVNSLKAQFSQLDVSFDQPLPNFLDVKVVFAGSKADALDYFRPMFLGVSSKHIHNKFKLLSEFLDFIDRPEYQGLKPKEMQSRFSLDSTKHLNVNGSSGCCIAAAYDFLRVLGPYGHIFGETKTWDQGFELSPNFEHVGAFVKFQNPNDSRDAGVILFDEYDHDVLCLLNGQTIKANGTSWKLDSNGDLIIKSILHSNNQYTVSHIPIKHLNNPDDTVGKPYLFGNSKLQQYHDFFIRRKHEALAKLDFCKRELTLRLGTTKDVPQVKFKFDDIVSDTFSIDVTDYSNEDIRLFFQVEFYKALGVSEAQFWLDIKRYIMNEEKIKKFFCFPDDISNISS